jgi:hypothetical protein
LKDASAGPSQIQEWWSKWPDANIGVPTGAVSGLLVVDLDNRGGKSGGDNLKALAASHGGMPSTLTAMTGSGEHLFYAYPGTEVGNSAGMLAEGVDVRGDGGYVVAAPSLHANGTRYVWREPDRALAELPDWLLNRMVAGKKRTTKMMQDVERQDYTDATMVMEGTRNNTLHKLGSALRGHQGKDRSEIASALLEYNQWKCNPPLVETEVMGIVSSVCQYPAEINRAKSGKRQEQCLLYWFPFNTRDYFADQNLAILTAEQLGWYIRLKAFAWNQCGFLTADPDKLWKLAKAKSRKAFERDGMPTLAEYIEVEIDGECRLKSPAMAAEYADKLELWIKKRDAGEASKTAKAARLAAFEASLKSGDAASGQLSVTQ